jgi:NADH dehydrogenase FAD-containing subunit
LLTLVDLQVIATGQTPQSELIRALSPESIDDAGFVRVRRTLQINDTNFSNIFAVGDVADTGAHKAARPALRQAPVVVGNIQHLANDESLEHYEVAEGPSIHLSLGLVSFCFFACGIDHCADIWPADEEYQVYQFTRWCSRAKGHLG